MMLCINFTEELPYSAMHHTHMTECHRVELIVFLFRSFASEDIPSSIQYTTIIVHSYSAVILFS